MSSQRSGVLLCCLLTSPLAGCGDGTTSETRQGAKLVVSGDTAGWIVPCGCTANQSGGLSRRGDYLRRMRSEGNVLYVDAGGAPSGTQPYDVTKFEAVLRGEVAMGVAAHNVGAAEAKLGAAELRRLAETTGTPFVSANVGDASGKRVAAPHVLLEAGGWRVLVVGVLSPSLAPKAVKVDAPERAILSALEETARKYDAAILLACAPEDELQELARRLPELDAIVESSTGQAIDPRAESDILLAAASNKGKFVVEIDLPTSASAELSGRTIELDETYDDDPRQTENLKAFYDRLAELDYAPAQTSFVSTTAPSDEDYRVSGVESCRSCHAGDCDLWEQSGHGHAWATLERTGAHVDSYCQRCHTDGFGSPGGFDRRATTPDRVNVGCESCHGPSQAHAKRPTTPTAYRGSAASQCIRCHDRENSPNFAYDAYWAKILHGPKASAADVSILQESGAVDDSQGGDP